MKWKSKRKEKIFWWVIEYVWIYEFYDSKITQQNFPSWTSYPKDIEDFLIKHCSKNWIWGLDNILKVSDVLVEKIWNIILWVRTFSVDTKVVWIVVIIPDSRKK